MREEGLFEASRRELLGEGTRHRSAKLYRRQQEWLSRSAASVRGEGWSNQSGRSERLESDLDRVAWRRDAGDNPA